MYDLKIDEKVDKVFKKLSKRNPKHLEIIDKKISELRENPHRYKNLRWPLNNWKRIHLNGCFVLTYSVDEANHKVIIEDYDHHDKVYKN